MNNIEVAKETIKITYERKYVLNGVTIDLPDVDPAKVIVITPDEGQKILDSDMSPYMSDSMCRITHSATSLKTWHHILRGSSSEKEWGKPSMRSALRYTAVRTAGILLLSAIAL